MSWLRQQIKHLKTKSAYSESSLKNSILWDYYFKYIYKKNTLIKYIQLRYEQLMLE